jgi:hypothetical protein
MISREPPSTTNPPERRLGVVAQALLEKFQRVSLHRRDLNAKFAAAKAVLEELERQLKEADSELLELQEALQPYGVPLSQPPLPEDEETKWRKDRDRFVQAQGHPPVADIYPESRQQKQSVVSEVRLILSTFGSMHVRDIHAALRNKGIAVPHVPRLSQILSESELFEADRSKGWSLKEERPGGREPGLPVPKQTPSGDGS